MHCRLVIAFCIAVLVAACAKDSEPSPELPPPDIKIETAVLQAGFQFPWEIIWGPDDFLWITERGGTISRVDPSSGEKIPVHNITESVSQGEGGLLGMALHPDFANSPFVFVAYNYSANGSYREKIVRFRYTGSALSEPLTLLEDIEASNIHNGCRLLINGDKIFITTGDAANENFPQDPLSRNGKVLRLNLDGSIPADNPIAGSPVWSIGHRNAQGLVRVGDNLYLSEHGPDSDDEINIIRRGANYGWPDVKGFCNDPSEQDFCNANDVVEPIIQWTPTLAVSGIDYYGNDAIPQWKHSLLVCTLKASRLLQVKMTEDGTGVDNSSDFFAGEYGRLRDLCVSPDGHVFICTSNGNDDKIIVVRPVSQ